jgi:type VI protein secretion system component Hcp
MPVFLQLGLPQERNRIVGSIKTPPHVGWFEASSFTYGVPNPASFGGSNTVMRRRPVDSIRITMGAESNAALLFKASADNTVFNTVVLDIGGDPPTVFVMKDAVISAYRSGGSVGQPPTFYVDFSFAGLEVHQSAVTAQLGARLPPNLAATAQALELLRQYADPDMA